INQPLISLVKFSLQFTTRNHAPIHLTTLLKLIQSMPKLQSLQLGGLYILSDPPQDYSKLIELNQELASTNCVRELILHNIHSPINWIRHFFKIFNLLESIQFTLIDLSSSSPPS